MSTCYIPNTLDELGKVLGYLTKDSLILAGGTDLVLKMRSKHLSPDILLSLSDIPELREIRITPEQAVIGSMATMHQVELALNGLEDLQALSDAAGGVGSPQIRNKASVGGNVANASPAADTPSVLWALNAQVNLMGPGGVCRSIPIQQFFTNGKTALPLGEVILSFTIDRTALKGWRSAFVKLGHRSQVTISRIGMVMVLHQDPSGVIQDARVVVGAIKPIPFPLPAAEDILRGNRPDPALAEALGATFRGNTRRAYKEAAAKGVFEDILLRFQD